MIAGPSQGTRGARKTRGELKMKPRPKIASTSQAVTAASRTRGEFRNEQWQNLRWVRAQPGISMTTLGELERYFTSSITNSLMNARSMQGATQLLSDEGQALVQRLQNERREALISKTGPGIPKDWFKKRRTHKQRPKEEFHNDLALLMDGTRFFTRPVTKRRHRNKAQKRLERRLKQSKAGEGAEKAGGDMVGKDAVKLTETLAHVVHGIDAMCLGGE